MTEQLTKLEQAKKIEYAIIGIDKHIELMGKILSSFADEYNNNPESPMLAPVCVKCNPKFSNYMPLDVRFMPTETSAFWIAYMKKAKGEKEKLQKELETLMN